LIYFPIRHALTTTIFVAATSVLVAQEPPGWKLSQGQDLNYRVESKVRLSMGQPPTDYRLSQEFDLTWTVKEVADDGKAQIQQVVERIVLKLDDPLGNLDYDSSKDEDPHGLAALMGPIFRAFREHPLTFGLSPDGEIVDLQIPEQVLSSMVHGPLAPPLSSFASKEGLRQLFFEGIVQFQGDPWKPGCTWSTSDKTSNEVLGPQKVERTFRYVREEQAGDDTLDVIETTRTIVNENAEQALLITAEEAVGEIRFNQTRGRLQSSQWTATTRLSPGGNETITPGKLHQSFTMTLVPPAEIKSDQPKADQPKADQPKADQPKSDQPKADQPKSDQPKSDQPKADQPKADQPKADQPEADQPEADQPEADQPKADQPKADQPNAQP
jgi:hypothetical protein